jgi:hypothetical protein
MRPQATHTRLKLRQFALAALLLSSVVAKAQNTAGSACRSVYKTTNELTKSLLGPNNDGLIAPRVDNFLSAYAQSYKSTPSYEEYMDRLTKHNFKGDRQAAYDFMQKFSRENNESQFNMLMDTLRKLEHLGGPLSGMTKPLDQGALDYVKCLREYMASSLRALPDNSYYDYKRSELLSQIEGGGSAPLSTAPTDSGQ